MHCIFVVHTQDLYYFTGIIMGKCTAYSAPPGQVGLAP